MEEIFTSTLPNIQGFIKELDLMDENVNAAAKSGIHQGAEIIKAEQQRLITPKSKRLAKAISSSRVTSSKKGIAYIRSGYLESAFSTDSDGFNPGVVGTMYEFGRPGSSEAKRSSKTMKQKRKRREKIWSKRGWKYTKAKKTEVEINKGTIQPVPHIRKGFDNKMDEATSVTISAIEKELDSIFRQTGGSK